jgi:hypothetical protein
MKDFLEGYHILCGWSESKDKLRYIYIDYGVLRSFRTGTIKGEFDNQMYPAEERDLGNAWLTELRSTGSVDSRNCSICKYRFICLTMNEEEIRID